MSPDWVLLDRCVKLSFDEEDDESSSSSAVKSMGRTKASFIPALYQATVDMLGSMKPEPVLVQPPGISTFRLLGSKSHRGRLGSWPFVACADKGLLVLYGGSYFGPGSSTCGCYLVYDAAAAAASPLSTVPPPPDGWYLNGIGSGAVVLRRHPPSSAYLLAELAIRRQRQLSDPDAVLLLWRSDEEPTPQWTRKEVQLPREVCWAPGKHMFDPDSSFSGPGYLCWVDLLQGIVICTNPWGPQDPVLRFISLPDGCPAVGTSDYPYRPRAEESRSATCVGGHIKVVAMVGLLEGCNSHQFRLTTWTLSPDLSRWQQDDVFRLEDLWATHEYRALNLPNHTPVYPVLSPREDAVVYAVVNDAANRDVVQGFRVVRTELEIKGQYVLGLDMRRNKIISSTGGPPPCMMPLTPSFMATDFCAFLHGAKDRQREVEASEVGDSGKRLKV